MENKMNENSTELETIEFPGSRAYEEVNYHYVLYLSELDSTEKLILSTVIARCDSKLKFQNIDKNCIKDLIGVGETKYKESFSKFEKLNIITKRGKTKAIQYRINKDVLPKLIKDNEDNLRKWRLYLDGFFNVRESLPAPDIIVEGTIEEQEANEQMKKDADTLKKKKTRMAKIAREVNEKEREEYVRIFYSELSENSLNKFLNLYKFLQLREYGEGLYRVVEKIREMGNPHTKDKKGFEKAIDAFMKLAEDGSSFRTGRYRNVNYKRNVFLKYLKNVTRPKFANCIREVSIELANEMASTIGFMERVNLMFKADKDPDFPVEYKSKLWHVFDLDGTAYIPLPYTENHVYVTYPLYDEKKYKDKK